MMWLPFLSLVVINCFLPTNQQTRYQSIGTMLGTTPDSRELRCYHCDNTYIPECHTLTTCDRNTEMCYSSVAVVAGSPRFTFGCFHSAVCRVLMNKTFEDMMMCFGHDLADPKTPQYVTDMCGEVEPTIAAIGRRQLGGQVNVCHACCGDSGCNNLDCRKLREKLFKDYKNHTLDPHTLGHI